MTEPTLRIKEIREAQGWTQRSLASEVGVTNGLICHFETGRTKPSFATLMKIADVLDVTLDALVERDFNAK